QLGLAIQEELARIVAPRGITIETTPLRNVALPVQLNTKVIIVGAGKDGLPIILNINYDETEGQLKMKFKVIASMLLAGLALVFISQNGNLVNIRFLFWTLTMSRSVLMFSFLLSGLILGWFIHSYSIQRRQKAKS
ncbi:LapA family protein, partial [candidate division KSB1 bacterium]|nr:LapA family protein [candidate division KSB1 bacterium]